MLALLGILSGLIGAFIAAVGGYVVERYTGTSEYQKWVRSERLKVFVEFMHLYSLTGDSLIRASSGMDLISDDAELASSLETLDLLQNKIALLSSRKFNSATTTAQALNYFEYCIRTSTSVHRDLVSKHSAEVVNVFAKEIHPKANSFRESPIWLSPAQRVADTAY